MYWQYGMSQKERQTGYHLSATLAQQLFTFLRPGRSLGANAANANATSTIRCTILGYSAIEEKFFLQVYVTIVLPSNASTSLV